MRVLVAGVTGVVGRGVARLLVEDGHDVWGTSRRGSPRPGVDVPGVVPIALDVLDRDRTFAVLRTVRPDVVVHQLTDLAGLDYAANTRLRIDGTPNLVDAALAVGVRRIVAQSIAFAYGPGEGLAVEDEALDVDGENGHGRLAIGVAALEAAVRRCPEWVALRYGILHGPGTWYANDGRIADEARRGELAASDAVTSFLHVDDAASMAVAALSWPSGVVNVVDDDPAPATEWAPLFAERVGAPAPARHAGREPHERGASNAYGRTLPGWALRHPTWRAGLGRQNGS